MMIDEAAIHLHNNLRYFDWFIKIRINGERLEVFVMSDSPKIYRRKIPEDWCGFPVEIVKERDDYRFL